MKAKVVFPAVGNESQWRPSKFDPAKRQSTIVVDVEGKTYALYATEGTAAWAAAKGAEIDVEIVSEPEQPGKHGFAKLAGQTRPPYSGGGYNKPAPQPLTPERAKEMALLGAAIYRTIAEKLLDVTPTPTSEDIRTITNTILMR